MKENNHTVTTLHDLLDYDARKIIDAENQLKKVLPEWMKKTAVLKLQEVFGKYAEHINKHIEKLESFFVEEKIFPLAPINRVMQAFIEDTEQKMASCSNADVKDACLLASIQEINHYKISMYGTAAAFANALEMKEAATIFYDAEISEKQIDDRLSQLAEHEINIKAKTPNLIDK